MKKQFLLVITLVVVPFALAGQTDISGTIANNTTLTEANSPYIVTDHINVNAGVTLTVESNVELRFNSGKYIQVFGTLTANNATFTANGSTTPGFWPGIYVSYQYNANFGTVELNNCRVEYAQSIHVRKGDLVLSNSTVISDFSSYGLDIYTAGTVAMENTSIQNSTYPVYFRGNGIWTTGSGNSLTGNTTDYIFINFRDINNEFILPDLGIPYYYDSELRVNSGGTLRLEPGVTLLGNTGAYIRVYGKIKALGNASEPVVFSNEPSNAYWSGLNIYDEAIDTACILNYCQFSGANYTYSNYRNYEIGYCAVEVIKSSPEFNNCEFSDNRYNLVVTGVASPTFTDCNFLESNYVGKIVLGINMDLNASPVFNNCSTAHNNSEGRAIGLIGSTVYDDVRLTHRSFTGIDSITYVLYGKATIHDTASLEIDPGIVIKCNDNDDYLYANGSLTGVGTTSKPIVFTFRTDDDFGNPKDTYNDGTTSIGRSSSGRLILNSEPTSNLENWIIRYAGRNSSSYAVYAYHGNIVKDCEIRYSHRGILFSHDAQIINNSFDDVSNYPLGRRMNEGAPVLIGNTISNSGHLGIFVHDFLEGTYSVEGFDLSGTPNVAYIFDGNRSIPTGADVTILPGTVFKFADYYGKLSVSGGLKADGSAGNKIIFTSIYDNSASGNTNFNGGADPTGYKWDGIQFYNSSNDALNELDNCEIRYVRYPVRMTDCRVVLDSVLLNFSNTQALGIYGSANPQITNCAFNNLGSAPIHMDMFASPSFSNNSLANVAQIGILINDGALSGTIPIRSFAGYDTITYLMFETMQINDELTIPAGLTFKGSGSTYFNINGRLNVLGTASHPVVFTSLQDDAYGNPKDTEQNGQASIGKNGNRLVFRDVSDDNSVVNHAIFRHSYSYAIHNGSASPTIKNTSFQAPASYALSLVGNSAPTVDSCTFHDCPYPMITSLLTYPGSHQGNVLSGSTAKGILIRDNETLTQDYTVPIRSFAGIGNIPYILDRFIVGTSAVMTITPGVIFKFLQSGYLLVRKGLIADGGVTPDSAIVFTANRDDFYGGDTYGDGEANLPNSNWWWGIYFPEESIDVSCFMDNCIIKHASRVYSYGANGNNRAGITINNASPTIQNCLLEDNFWGMIVRNTSLPVITNCDFVETHPTYGYGVWNETGTVSVTAENCWWNDASGPYHPTLNPGGLGERVSDNVDFDPWITETAKPIMGDLSLNGEVMPYDASLVLQYTVDNITLNDKQLGVADVSGNGTVSSLDASLILQYSIGLITNFDEAPLKSGSNWDDLVISAPAEFQATGDAPFVIPVSLTTPASVKALDLELSTDPEHLRFIGLSDENLPPDVMVASGYREESGILKIALASAYDLGLNLHELGLIFELRDRNNDASGTVDPISGTGDGASSSGSGHGTRISSIELQKLAANEIAIAGALFTTRVESQGETTGIEDVFSPEPVPGLNSCNIYSTQKMIVTELDLVNRQSTLIIWVYDMSGRKTNTVRFDNTEAGAHRYTFHAEASGNPLINGVTRSTRPVLYLVTIRGDDFVLTRKIAIR